MIKYTFCVKYATNLVETKGKAKARGKPLIAHEEKRVACDLFDEFLEIFDVIFSLE